MKPQGADRSWPGWDAGRDQVQVRLVFQFLTGGQTLEETLEVLGPVRGCGAQSQSGLSG